MLIQRYRSRSRERSRSQTPPHWKREQEKLRPWLKELQTDINDARWTKGDKLKAAEWEDDRQMKGRRREIDVKGKEVDERRKGIGLKDRFAKADRDSGEEE